ncbi:MAG: C1 family peptidase [Thermaceae bacterium]|nr:C1 family peptidase [Thermaceae bacterium]
MHRYSTLLPLLLLLASCGGGSGPPQTGTFGPGIREILSLNGVPAFKLSNGEIELLDKPEDTQWYLDRFPPPPASTSQQVRLQDLPASVDLSAYQTPVKDQNPRGTCTNFAVVAALEVRYKRQYGLSLDLSEQWLNHFQKMDALDTQDTTNDSTGDHRPKAPGTLENQLGMWGGGSVVYNLRLLSSGKLGIPEEGAMPYFSGNNGNSSLWNPPITSSSSQRTIDDFNLSQQSVTYKMPYPTTLTVLPQNAQNTARYQAGQVIYASSSELGSLDWFKTQLASGSEVAFSVLLDSDDPNPNNNIWEIADKPRTDPKTWAGHAMLMVGYDDSKRAFRVKNSWGTGWAEGGYVWFSYDFVTKGKMREGAVVKSVLPPNTAPPSEPLFIGRYSLDHDGWQGILDLYHIPDPNLFKFQSGTPDRRLGTYYGPDGLGRRVNGTLSGRKIDFYIDWNNPGARSYGELSGLHFTGYLSTDNQSLTGTMLDNRDGQTYGFYGLKRGYLSGISSGSSVTLNSYVGNWQVYGLEVPTGNFSITAVNPNTGQVTGKVFGGGTLTGTVNTTNPRLFSFQLNGVTYQGYLFGHEAGVMAGTADPGTGFVATRSDFSTPLVSIQNPAPGDTLYRTQSYTLAGQATGDNGSGFANQPLPCTWTSSDAGDSQFPISGNCTPTIQIRPGSPSSVTFTLSTTAYGGKSAQTGVTVNVQNPPNSGPPVVSILEPVSGSAGSVGTSVFLRASWVGGTAPYNGVRWTWQATHKAGCAETDIPAVYHPPIYQGQEPYWSWDTTGAQNVANGCGFDNDGGTIRFYVTDSLNLTGSASTLFKLTYVPPPN